jgi:hypothetical protein
LLVALVLAPVAQADSRVKAKKARTVAARPPEVAAEPAPLVPAPPPPPPPAPVVVAPVEPVVDEAGEIQLTVAHHFERAIAKERVSQLLAYWNDRFQVKNDWHGDRVFVSGSVFGVEIKALFEVTDDGVVCRSKDPGMVWRAKGAEYVEKKLKKYLHPTYEAP